MRIKFEFQGGYSGLFAAQPLARDVDVNELPDGLRAKLIGLIENAGIMEAEPGQGAEKRRARATPTITGCRSRIRDRRNP